MEWLDEWLVDLKKICTSCISLETPRIDKLTEDWPLLDNPKSPPDLQKYVPAFDKLLAMKTQSEEPRILRFEPPENEASLKKSKKNVKSLKKSKKNIKSLKDSKKNVKSLKKSKNGSTKEKKMTLCKEKKLHCIKSLKRGKEKKLDEPLKKKNCITNWLTSYKIPKKSLLVYKDDCKNIESLEDPKESSYFGYFGYFGPNDVVVLHPDPEDYTYILSF